MGSTTSMRTPNIVRLIRTFFSTTRFLARSPAFFHVTFIFFFFVLPLEPRSEAFSGEPNSDEVRSPWEVEVDPPCGQGVGGVSASSPSFRPLAAPGIVGRKAVTMSERYFAGLDEFHLRKMYLPVMRGPETGNLQGKAKMKFGLKTRG